MFFAYLPNYLITHLPYCMIKLNAQQLRESEPTSQQLKQIKRNPLYIIVDNVLDTYNVGAIFRLADAAAVSGVYLVGETAVPTDPLVGHKIHKASVGVWQWMKWKHVDTIKEAIEDINSKLRITNDGLRKKTLHVTRYKLQVIAIEQSP